MQLSDGAADVMRLDAIRREVADLGEERREVKLIIAPRSGSEAALVRQMIEIRLKQRAPGVGCGGVGGVHCIQSSRARAAAASSPMRRR